MTSTIGGYDINAGSSMAALKDVTVTTNGTKTQLDTRVFSTTTTTVNLQAYRSSDATFQPVRLDKATNTLQTMDYEHHEIHGGSFFRAGYQKDIGNAGTAVVAFITPNTTKWLHFRPAVDVEAEAGIMLYENPTTVTAGTAILPRNANRNSSTTSGTVVLTDPSINITGATILGNVVIGSGKATGGESSAQHEWILKQGEEYVLVVTNKTTGNNEVNIRCQWYEHTDIA